MTTVVICDIFFHLNLTYFKMLGVSAQAEITTELRFLLAFQPYIGLLGLMGALVLKS
jgi:hypothetical protein